MLASILCKRGCSRAATWNSFVWAILPLQVPQGSYCEGGYASACKGAADKKELLKGLAHGRHSSVLS